MRHADEGQLHALLDGEPQGMEGWSPGELEDHIAHCEACAARLEAARRIRQDARALLGSSAPQTVTEPPFGEILARRRAARGGRRTPPWVRPLAWAASIVLALGLGWQAREWLRPPEQVAVGESQPPEVPFDARQDALPVAPGAPLAPAEEQLASSPEELARGGDPQAGAEGAEGRSELARTAEPVQARERAVREPEESELALADRADDVAMAPPPPPPPAPPPPAAADEAFADPATEATTGNAAAPEGATGAPAALLGAWTLADRAAASDWLGREPMRIAGLQVVGYATGWSARGAAVRVRQRLPGGELLELVQVAGLLQESERRSLSASEEQSADKTARQAPATSSGRPPSPAAAADRGVAERGIADRGAAEREGADPGAANPGTARPDGTFQVEKRIGDVWITASAAVPPDSLRKLLEKVEGGGRR